MAALPQQLGAEGVDGGDARLVHQGGLTAQVAVGGPQSQPVGQLLHNTAPQLGSGSLGVGDDQEAVYVGPLLHPGQQTFYQHPGLTGACRSGYQKAAPPVIYRRLLFFCQGKGHLVSPFLWDRVLSTEYQFSHLRAWASFQISGSPTPTSS